MTEAQTGTGGTPIPDFLSVVSQQLQGRPHVVMTYVTNDQDPGYLQQEVRYTLTDTNGWEEPFEDENITTYPFSTLPAEQGVASPGSLVTTTITTAQGAFSSTPGFKLGSKKPRSNARRRSNVQKPRSKSLRLRPLR